MVNSGLQLAGFCLALVGWLLAIVTTFLDSWGKNDLSEESLDLNRVASGLWTQCSARPDGKRTCDDYVTFFLGLPASLQGARAGACASIVFGFIGAIFGAFGMECTSFASDNAKLKARMVKISGFLYVLTGASIGTAASLFASDILHGYYKYNTRQFKMQSALTHTLVYGPALFVGWTSMIINVISGLILCCSSWSVEEEDRSHPFTYNPSRTKAAEYI